MQPLKKPLSEVAGNVRLLLVDDHPITLGGLAQCLSGKDNVEIVGTAANGIEAIQKARTLLPDVVLLDITLPDISGLQVLKVLRSDQPASKVIIYTMHNNNEYVRECLSLGARGYILKSSAPDTIIEAIHAVQTGELALDSTILKTLSVKDAILEVTTFRKDAHVRMGILRDVKSRNLTEKEKRILQLIVEGCTIQQAADKLDVRYNTMTTHFKHIYKKLEVHNRSSLVAKALKERIVEFPLASPQ